MINIQVECKEKSKGDKLSLTCGKDMKPYSKGMAIIN